MIIYVFSSVATPQIPDNVLWYSFIIIFIYYFPCITYCFKGSQSIADPLDTQGKFNFLRMQYKHYQAKCLMIIIIYMYSSATTLQFSTIIIYCYLLYMYVFISYYYQKRLLYLYKSVIMLIKILLPYRNTKTLLSLKVTTLMQDRLSVKSKQD